MKQKKNPITGPLSLNERHLAISAGTVFGLLMFSMTILSTFTGYGYELISVLSSIYPFYEANMAGAVVGFVWGFIDAFVVFYLLGWLYNYLEYNQI